LGFLFEEESSSGFEITRKNGWKNDLKFGEIFIWKKCQTCYEVEDGSFLLLMEDASWNTS